MEDFDLPPPPDFDGGLVYIPVAAVPDAPPMDIPMAPMFDPSSIPAAPPVPSFVPPTGGMKSLGDILNKESKVVGQRKAQLNKTDGPQQKEFDQGELMAAVLERRKKLNKVPQVQKNDEGEKKNELQNTIAQGLASLRKVGARRPSMGEAKGKGAELDMDKYREMGGQRPKWKPKSAPEKVDMKDVDLRGIGFRCEKCKLEITNMDCIDTQNGLFHPDCFSCTGCAKMLIGEYLTVNEVYFHPECLNCTVCALSLIDQALMCTPEKKLYCSKDAPRDRCAGCSEKCESGRVVQLDNRIWHEACLICAECRTPLAGKQFLTQDNLHYCKPCYQVMHAPKCARCLKVADGPVLKLNPPDGSQLLYHEKCYTCVVCHDKLRGKGSYPFNGDIYCKKHYDEVKAAVQPS